jgi:hypothetical protein
MVSASAPARSATGAVAIGINAASSSRPKKEASYSPSILGMVLDRRQERTELRVAHATELRKKAAETEARLKRFHDAIKRGLADLGDDSPRERIAELRALKAQAQADAERAAIALEGIGADIAEGEVRIMGSRRNLLRTLAAASGAASAGRCPALYRGGGGDGIRTHDRCFAPITV